MPRYHRCMRTIICFSLTIWSLFHSMMGSSQAAMLPVNALKPCPQPIEKVYSVDDTVETPDWSVMILDHEIYATDSDLDADAPLPFDIPSESLSRFPIAGTRYVHPVHDGFLVGWNRGEWGGTLWWFSKDGRNNYVISNADIMGFAVRGSDILMLEGLAHGEFDEGQIVQLRKTGDRYERSHWLTIPAAPRTFTTAANGELIIVTDQCVLAIDNARNIKTIVSDKRWNNAAWPNSIAIEGDAAFIGMGSAILELHLTDGTQTWFCP